MMMYREPLPNLDNEYIDLRQVLQTLIEKKRLLILVSLISFVLAMSYAVWKPTQYKASVLLEVHPKQESSFGALSEKKEASVEEPISLQIALIRSKFILEPVIQKLKLDTSKTDSLNQILSRLIITNLSPSESATKTSGILQLTLIGHDAQKTIQLINAIALMAQKKDKERKSLEALQRLAFLNKEVPIIQASLKKAESELNNYRAASGKIDIKLQTQSLLTHLADINKQLEIIRLKRMDMSELYTMQHPFLIAINQKQKELESLQTAILKQIQKLPATDQVAANLSREVDIKNSLYVALLSKIHEQQVIAAGIVSDIRILSLATFADKIAVPNLALVGLASLLIGSVLGAIGIVIGQLFKRRSKYSEFYSKKNVSLVSA